MSEAARAATLMPPTEAGWQRFAALMQAEVGLVLPSAGALRVAARLAPRLRRLGLEGFDAYVELLDTQRDAAELPLLLDLLTAPEAGFFREPGQFELLESELGSRRPGRLRLWSAATAFGDEAYSLAMLLADLQQAGRIGADWTVVGTDVSERRLRSAAEGLYPESRLRQLTPERLRRHGLAAGATGLAQMPAALREHLRFERHDLRQPLAAGEVFDAVMLRQLLIYFDAAVRREVVAHVLATLRPGGLFFVGAAEQGLVGDAALEPLGAGAFRKS